MTNVICEELQNDRDFTDSFSHEHTLLITGEGDPVEIIRGWVIFLNQIFSPAMRKLTISSSSRPLWQLNREQNAYLSSLMTLMSIFCCYIIIIRKSSTFQCSWNPLFTEDKLQTYGNSQRTC